MQFDNFLQCLREQVGDPNQRSGPGRAERPLRQVTNQLRNARTWTPPETPQEAQRDLGAAVRVLMKHLGKITDERKLTELYLGIVEKLADLGIDIGAEGLMKSRPSVGSAVGSGGNPTTAPPDAAAASSFPVR
jgi:hypothetical protein